MPTRDRAVLFLDPLGTLHESKVFGFWGDGCILRPLSTYLGLPTTRCGVWGRYDWLRTFRLTEGNYMKEMT